MISWKIARNDTVVFPHIDYYVRQIDVFAD